MAQFRTGLNLGDAAGYGRSIRMARDVLLYARQRKSLLAAQIDQLDPRARSGPRQALAAEAEDNMLVSVQNVTDPDQPLSLVIRRTDLYMISVHNRHAGFYFADTMERQRRHESQVGLRFGSSYVGLGHYGTLPQFNAAAIHAAVNAVARWQPGTPISNVRKNQRGDDGQSAEARQLLILILISAEAFRFRPVAQTVEQAVAGDSVPAGRLGELDTLVRDWDRRSRAATASGTIDPEIGVPSLG
jgi:hypothetical protein